jgi:uncharacterized protein YbjT (DUF2867 family)
MLCSAFLASTLELKLQAGKLTFCIYRLLNMPESISVTLLGSTGLTGSATLRSLLSSTSQPFSIRTFTRSPPASTPSGHQATTHANRTFPDLFGALTEQLASKGDVYVSCLGTTRGAAGGFENQKKIDLDLNRDLAKKARADGASVVSPLI